LITLDEANLTSVTTVGGTTGISPEVAVNRFYSGGGFSNYVRFLSMWAHVEPALTVVHQFARPSYQDAAVQGYIDALPNGTYAGLYNTFVSSIISVQGRR